MNLFTTDKKELSKNKIQVALSCVILLFLWEIIALKIDNDIYLPTLGQVFISIKEIISDERFIINIFSTITRCILSFILTLITAFMFSIISNSFNL